MIALCHKSTARRTVVRPRFPSRCIANPLRRLWCLFALLLIAPLAASAATYYIDYASGNDGNAGTSTGAPWKHCPGDSRATGNAAITAQPGDIFILKGGVVYQLVASGDRISVNGNGASGSPIVFDGDSGTYVARWGSGNAKAIIDGNSTATQAMYAPTRSWLVINNFEMRKSGYGGSYVAFTTSASNCIVSNCYLHRRYDWDLESGPNKTGAYIRDNGRGINIEGTTNNITIDNCEITRLGGGIRIAAQGASQNVHDITVKNCDLHDYMVWFIDVNTYSGGVMSNIVIRNNKFRNLFHYSGGYWTGSIPDEKLNYSNQSNPHEDGIFIRQPGSTAAIQNLQIFNNEFYNDISLTGANGTAWIYCSQLRTGTSVYIYNNQIQNPSPYYSISIGYNYNYAFTVYVYHNTFALERMNAIKFTESVSSNPAHAWHFKNNLVFLHNGNTGIAFRPESAYCSSLAQALTSDYNFFDLGSGQMASGTGICYASATLPDWQAYIGKDLNSSAGSANLVSVQTGASVGSSDLRLQSTSGAIGASLVLDPSIYPGADYDADGNFRGTSGQGADAGAFHFVGGPSYIVNEDGEGTGTPAGWSDTGSVNWDFTSNVVSGAQALFLNHSATANYTEFTTSAHNNLYASAWFRTGGTPSAQKMIMGFYDGASNKLCSVELDDADWELLHGASNPKTTGNQQAASTWYRLWLEYEAGSGSNGVARLYISTTGAKPVSPTLSTTTGTAIAGAVKLRLGGTVYNNGMTFDDIRLSTSPIP